MLISEANLKEEFISDTNCPTIYTAQRPRINSHNFFQIKENPNECRCRTQHRVPIVFFTISFRPLAYGRFENSHRCSERDSGPLDIEPPRTNVNTINRNHRCGTAANDGCLQGSALWRSRLKRDVCRVLDGAALLCAAVDPGSNRESGVDSECVCVYVCEFELASAKNRQRDLSAAISRIYLWIRRPMCAWYGSTEHVI